MNKRFLIGLIVSLLSANQSFAVPGSFINLPSNWNDAGFCNLFNSLSNIVSDLESSSADLSDQATLLLNAYNQLPANIVQRNNELDCVALKLVEEYACVNTCSQTLADLNGLYNTLVAKIASDKLYFQNLINDINSQIQTLGNMLTTFDSLTSDTALQMIDQLEAIKTEYQAQEDLRSSLAASLVTIKGAIDSLAIADHSTEVQNQLSDEASQDYVGLSC